jgi:hypothetical protein
MAMMSATVMRASHSLGGDRLGAISSGLRIASRLLNPARSSLSLCSRLLGLGSRSFSARGSLVSAVRRIHGARRWIGLIGRASCRKRKGQRSPGSQPNKFRGFLD